MGEEDRIFNFGAGPSCLPEPVLLDLQSTMMNWNKTGMSILEISHRSKEFESLVKDTEKKLRDLLNIGNAYDVLFVQGGANGQFAGIPMNLCSSKEESIDYFVSGNWSMRAATEALAFCNARIIASGKEKNFNSIPLPLDLGSPFRENPGKYFYYCANETISGLEILDHRLVEPLNEYYNGKVPPLVSDMSSNILTTLFDINRFGLIFFGTQKNLGISGLTMVVVRKDIIGKQQQITPSIWDYSILSKNNSLFNTPPTFNIYVMERVLNHIINLGGVEVLERNAKERSQRIYNLIDSSNGFYNGVMKNHEDRSRTNVTFRLENEELENEFVRKGKEQKLIGLGGHRTVGGIRASIYNAMSDEGVEKLREFMIDFQNENQ